jgi:D-alanyl-D-alanine carboxypeptidase
MKAPRRRTLGGFGPAIVVLAVLAAGCSAVEADDSSPTSTTAASHPDTSPATQDPTTTSGPDLTSPATTDPTDPTDSPPTSDIVTTTISQPVITIDATPSTLTSPVQDIPLPHLVDAFNFIIGTNDAVSLTVIRDHAEVLGLAAGVGASGQPVTPDTPLVLASVSKLVTALTIARLAERGKIDLDAPVPWTSMYLDPDSAWDNVTVRELLTHTSGMPVARATWLNTPGSCAIPLTEAMAKPPTATRGKWTYSNGNYCALGLLVQVVTGKTQQEAADQLVFDPIAVSGPHLTTDGLQNTDGPYREGVARLERLGGAGTWLASSDDVAHMLDSVTADDLRTLAWPAIIADQYGWGHTGTIDGAKACAWVMEGGRTVIVAIVAGSRPATGGKVCDVVIPALATDLGIWADKPIRSPE